MLHPDMKWVRASWHVLYSRLKYQGPIFYHQSSCMALLPTVRLDL